MIKFDKNKPNVLIGVNDCGKTTILKAIGLLLDQKPRFYYSSKEKKKDDISNTRVSINEFNDFFKSRRLPLISYSESQCVIVGKFTLEENDFEKIKSNNYSNHLTWVLEKVSDNCIWMAKSFGEYNSFEYLLTYDSKDKPKELYKESNSNLNKLKSSLNITNQDIENENRTGRFKNIELIKTIYKKFDQALYWVEYKIDKDFWPVFRYLDWNISLDQLSSFANEILKSKVEEYLKSIEVYAKEQAEKAQDILNKELDIFTRSFAADLPSINTIKANIVFQTNSVLTDLLVNKKNSDGDVHLDSQGEGVKKQLWFALIKWSALRPLQISTLDTKFIWCFDEPETHLYPKAQREFFDLIREISQYNVQSVISTHSTVFIDRADFNSIRKVYLNESYTSISDCLDVTDIYNALKLKNSDFLFYDKFLVVEGDTEQELIPQLYKLYTGKSLVFSHIQLINLGGKENRKHNQFILRSILKGFKKDISDCIFYIFDSDAKCDFKESELKEIDCLFLGRQDIEDSLCSTAWVRLINDKIGDAYKINKEEIDNIKMSISQADFGVAKLQNNQKFYPRLRNYLISKVGEEVIRIFPSKGSEHGKLLASYINNVDLLHDEMKLLFDRMQS